MEKMKLLVKASALTLAVSLITPIAAHADMSHSGSPHWGKYHHHMYDRNFKLVNYGYLNVNQTLSLAVPPGVASESRVTCWSRNLMAGKIKLDIPNYGKVKITPNNPLVVFGAPTTQFTATYIVKHGFLSKFGFHHGNSTTNYQPAHLVCIYRFSR